MLAPPVNDDRRAEELGGPGGTLRGRTSADSKARTSRTLAAGVAAVQPLGNLVVGEGDVAGDPGAPRHDTSAPEAGAAPPPLGEAARTRVGRRRLAGTKWEPPADGQETPDAATLHEPSSGARATGALAPTPAAAAARAPTEREGDRDVGPALAGARPATGAVSDDGSDGVGVAAGDPSASGSGSACHRHAAAG